MEEWAEEEAAAETARLLDLEEVHFLRAEAEAAEARLVMQAEEAEAAVLLLAERFISVLVRRLHLAALSL